MKNLKTDKLTSEVQKAYKYADCHLPPDIAIVIECCSESETNETARDCLCELNENFRVCADKGLSLCEYTDSISVFVDIGRELRLVGGTLADAIWDALPKNIKAELFVRTVDGESMDVTISPHCEAMRTHDNVTELSSIDELEQFVMNSAKKLNGKPCPPLVVGIGLTDNAGDAVVVSRRALTEYIDERNPDLYLAELENKIMASLNSLGIGAMNRGGSYTALSVIIRGRKSLESSTFCSVSFGCHATRRTSAHL